jgi:23S rRNA pseudouridine1911/1915/1917 synthase
VEKGTEISVEIKEENKNIVNQIEKHVVPEKTEPIRLRNYAQTIFSTVYPSNKSLKKAIKDGLLLVNDQPGTTATFVQAGDTIILLEQASETSYSYPLTLEVIYEDEHFAIINKPSGIATHNHFKRNIVNALPFNIKKSELEDQLAKAHPIHRLDAQTSGLMIVAKTRSFQMKAGQMLENKEIEKRYTAIVIGTVPNEGKMDAPIDNLESLSEYQLVEKKPHDSFEWLNLIHLYPKTGRTHQLRIHCANTGFPILGDRLYSFGKSNLKGKGIFLCATKLSFKHPLTGELQEFEIKPPAKFSKFFNF